MASSISEDLLESPHVSFQTNPNRGKLSLADLAFAIPTNPHPVDNQSIVTQKSIEKIPTLIIWSIFNLLLIPFGIVCCYFSYKVKQYKKQYQYPMAIKWSKRTLILNITTTLLMIGIIITVVMLRYDYEKTHPIHPIQTTVAYIPWLPGR
ncbi:unnamed protein product [Adineta steineri]|uniref:Uncharacterized protein n=1 Tax=Adineta steineri TaxID=433720 RepID=A0A814K6X2_9BILA|nr:unnamed protein product [Adineta steineri]CAF1047760.1 unnamed protein product [Adineta steineri]